MEFLTLAQNPLILGVIVALVTGLLRLIPKINDKSKAILRGIAMVLSVVVAVTSALADGSAAGLNPELLVKTIIDAVTILATATGVYKIAAPPKV